MIRLQNINLTPPEDIQQFTNVPLKLGQIKN